jgi:hypothetical protein
MGEIENLKRYLEIDKGHSHKILLVNLLIMDFMVSMLIHH